MFDPVLPEPLSFHSCHIQILAEHIVILARTTNLSAACPACGRPSARVHSRYTRKLADLPWHGRPVQLLVEVRRFFCDTAGCHRRIFAERVTEIVVARGRQTVRLSQALTGIGFACGGEGGARLACRLGMPTSPDTLLRRIRQAAPAPRQPPRVLGVDDWAVRRGMRYGTILCDLEQHRAVDLLNQRSANSLAEWLTACPGIEIISRDRAGCYAQGAAAGAPGAQQVADRWHLLHNVREALIRLLDRRHVALRDTARAVARRSAPRAPPAALSEMVSPNPPVLSPTQQLSHARRARRLQRYHRVRELHQQGLSQRAIARQLGLDRETVARFIHAETFPERGIRPYPTAVDAFATYLQQRWVEGCRNAVQLTRELAARGFRGSYCAVRRYLNRWFRSNPTQPCPVPAIASPHRTPSAKRVAAWLLKPGEQLEPRELAFVEALTRANPDLTAAGMLAQEFGRL